jgi:hypothetical protein
MGKRRSPRSTRGVYLVKINNRNVASRLKISTGNFLGLTKQPELVNGKGTSIKDGSKGTKSFKLVLKNAVALDGVRVQRLSFPVDGKVTVKAFYKYAKAAFSGKGVGAIITPDGIMYAWDKINRSGGGGLLPRLPELPRLPLPELGNLITPEQGQQLGGYLGGQLAGPVGGAIGGALGNYLADYI